MKEEELNTLRQQDLNLRDALRLDEAELPQMPSDLNARLMQRVADEQKRTRKTTVRRLWPWVAAACVAAFIAVNVTPPKDPTSPPAPLQEARGVVTPKTEKVEEKAESLPKVAEAAQPQIAEVKRVQKATVKPRKQQPTTAEIEPKVDHGDSSPDPSLRSDHGNCPHDLQLAQTTTTKVQKQTLTEHDIPITRPENYKYTPEELAQLRKQADEAYLKWVELELEISKNNLQQTAEK